MSNFSNLHKHQTSLKANNFKNNDSFLVSFRKEFTQQLP